MAIFIGATPRATRRARCHGRVPGSSAETGTVWTGIGLELRSHPLMVSGRATSGRNRPVRIARRSPDRQIAARPRTTQSHRRGERVCLMARAGAFAFCESVPWRISLWPWHADRFCYLCQCKPAGPTDTSSRHGNAFERNRFPTLVHPTQSTLLRSTKFGCSTPSYIIFEHRFGRYGVERRRLRPAATIRGNAPVESNRTTRSNPTSRASVPRAFVTLGFNTSAKNKRDDFRTNRSGFE